jgi:hypothetical protein
MRGIRVRRLGLRHRLRTTKVFRRQTNPAPEQRNQGTHNREGPQSGHAHGSPVGRWRDPGPQEFIEGPQGRHSGADGEVELSR